MSRRQHTETLGGNAQVLDASWRRHRDGKASAAGGRTGRHASRGWGTGRNGTRVLWPPREGIMPVVTAAVFRFRMTA